MSEYIAKKPRADGWIDFTESENQTWAKLYQRQQKIVETRACSEFLDGLVLLNLSQEKIPQIPDMNAVLRKTTGWSVQAVDAIIPVEYFFELLSNKCFPVATFIRRPEDLDYIKEPDLFHEYFGHCPLLTNQAYADFMHQYGQLALKLESKWQHLLARLFWFTIEFGLIKSTDQYLVYGGGILSSQEETVYAVSSDKAERRPFDLDVVLRTPYRIDILQPVYYYIDSLDSLYQLLECELLKAIKKADFEGDFVPSFVTC